MANIHNNYMHKRQKDPIQLNRLERRLRDTLDYLLEQFAINNQYSSKAEQKEAFANAFISDVQIWIDQAKLPKSKELKQYIKESKTYLLRGTRKGRFEVKEILQSYFLNSTDENFDAFQGYHKFAMPYPEDVFTALSCPKGNEEHSYCLTRMSRIEPGKVSRSLVKVFTRQPSEETGYYWRYSMEKLVTSENDTNKSIPVNHLKARGIIQPNYRQIFFVGAERYYKNIHKQKKMVHIGSQTVHFHDNANKKIIGICTSAIDFKTEPCASVVILEPRPNMTIRDTGIDEPTKEESKTLNNFNKQWGMLMCTQKPSKK